MSQIKKFISLDHLISELEMRCEQGQTGKFLISVRTGGLAWFWLDGGRIVNINYGDKRGLKALPYLAQIEACTTSFLPSSGSSQEMMLLPPNEEMFNQLRSESPVSVAISVTHISQEVKTELKEILAKYIGPMADVVCARTLSRLTNTETAISVLASKIPDPKRASAFKAEASASIH
ncbi:MAG: hypothetical protein OEU26_12325 [Candidatus Tectomicrobia bacterium]|nr:hypothetical protein [Candidatus Tectomicrobia bacterium]